MSKGQVTGIEDFNWEGLGKHDEIYTAEQKAELEAAYGDTVNSIAAHEVIEGKIVNKSKRSCCKHRIQIWRCYFNLWI